MYFGRNILWDSYKDNPKAFIMVRDVYLFDTNVECECWTKTMETVFWMGWCSRSPQASAPCN